MNPTDQVLINIILYVFLPLWCAAGFVDWYCHRKSKIESTSGVKESLLHALMGVQVGIPIFLCLFFHVNALVLIAFSLSLLMHGIVAYFDIRLARKERQISILEMHAHAFLSTTPLFLFFMLVAINWQTLAELFHAGSSSSNHFSLIPATTSIGGPYYAPVFATLLLLFCVIPYLEELHRCARARVLRKQRFKTKIE